MSRRGPVMPDHQTAKVAGVACIVVGALMLYDAYDARGISRPFWTKLLPGG